MDGHPENKSKEWKTMRTDKTLSSPDAQETIASLQRQCCALLHHPAPPALLVSWLSRVFCKRH